MISIVLNKNISCEYLCKVIGDFVNKQGKNIENHVLTIDIREILEEQINQPLLLEQKNEN